MFVDFFFQLRGQKIPVTLSEWMLLMRALKEGLLYSDLGRFYYVCRALLVKNEVRYDAFDRVFLDFFKGREAPVVLSDDIRNWLERTPLKRFFSEEELSRLQKLSLEELNRLFQERLEQQKNQHHGGNHWIGTGGTSPFGHGGFHPSGIRVGGASGNRSAVKIAGERRFQNYRHDLTLDIRQIKVALKKLRELRRFGAVEELDLEATIGKTCRNAGDIELIFQAPRKNRTKVLLLMDAGGTMDPYAQLVSQLFSAAHSSTHFKDFQHFYFHNCLYSRIYRNIERSESLPTVDLFRQFDGEYRLIIVGDAWMNPYELYYDNGTIDFSSRERTSGIEWLQRVERHFKKSVWLNPEREDYWGAETISAIRQIFKMFPLTLEGLQDAVTALL